MTITLLMAKYFISCVVCFVTLVLSFLVHKQRKERNYIILFYFKNKTTNIAKTCGCKSSFGCENFEKEMSNPMKSVFKRQLAKKRPNVFSFEISDIFGAKYVFKKDVVLQK